MRRLSLPGALAPSVRVRFIYLRSVSPFLPTRRYSPSGYREGGTCYHAKSDPVVVRIVDSCKCYYPPNLKSNRRWW